MYKKLLLVFTLCSVGLWTFSDSYAFDDEEDFVEMSNTSVTEKSKVPASDTMAPSVVSETQEPLVENVASSVNIVQKPQFLESAPISPIYVKSLAINQPGMNSSNPTWAKTQNLLSFERNDERNKELVIASIEGEIKQTISFQSKEDEFGLAVLLDGFSDTTSYNAGITWSPDGMRYVFMSNGTEANYDLYLGDMMQSTPPLRITNHPEKEGHAHWSPVNNKVLFISGRSGTAQVYIYDLDTKTTSQITIGNKPFLYPQWSPDGSQVALIHGDNSNHDIYVITELDKPNRNLIALTDWAFDDLRPIWSPDGSKIAFYSNYNESNDPKLWSLIVLDLADKNTRTADQLQKHVVAENIIPDIEKGPAWLPGSTHIVFVKNDRDRYNPLHVVDVNTGVSRLLQTNTKINHDVSCSPQGLIAFRSQVDQWDQIFITQLPANEHTVN